MDSQEAQDWERLCELIWGCAIGQAIHVSVELGLVEILRDGPASTADLAAASHADAWALETVLRALAAHGVLSCDEGRRYGLTGMGRLLLASAPGPCAGEAGEFFDTLYRSLGALGSMVRTGEVAFDQVHGESFYAHLAQRPGLAAHFYRSMQQNAVARYQGLQSVVDFAGIRCVVDVGGGEGSLLAGILSGHPHLQGLLLELPVVIEKARATLAQAGLLQRCELVAGDFREAVPPGGDVYLLANVLNNWRDEEALQVLAACRAAMGEGARLLVLEAVLGQDLPPRWRALVSLGVMAQRGGRTRSEDQMRALLAAAGFAVDQLLPLPGGATSAVWASLAAHGAR